MRNSKRTAPLRCTLGSLLALLLAPAAGVAGDLAGGSASVEHEALPLPEPRGLDAAASLAVDPAGTPPALDADALLQLAQRDVAALGPLSIGTPDAGLLVNPMPMPSGPYWKLRRPQQSYGTAETITFITSAIECVEARFPGSPRVVIGDISRADGGQLSRHRSHQAGRDADVGFFYAHGGALDFVTARGRDLDLPRTWALVRAFLTETDVERIFLDKSLIAVLYGYARDQEDEDVDWLDDVFGRLGEGHKGIIQHVKGHKDHMHVRFYNRQAQEYGRVVYPLLVEEGAVPPPRVQHRAHRGETLGWLAARFRTTVSAIRVANGMRGSRLRPGRRYVIPIRHLPEETAPVVIPARRLPPPPAVHAAAEPATGELVPQVSSGVSHSGAGGGS